MSCARLNLVAGFGDLLEWKMQRAFLVAFLTSTLAITSAGCRSSDLPDLAEVSGTVTLDGKPLAGATVIFQPVEGGRSSQGRTDASGRYELVYLRDIEGAIVGQHEVSITTFSEESPEERVPAKYNRQTELLVEVAPGAENELNFELER